MCVYSRTVGFGVQNFSWRSCLELELELAGFRHIQLNTQLVTLIDDIVSV